MLKRNQADIRWGSIPCTWPSASTPVWCPCKQENPLLLRGLCSSSNLKSFGEGQYYKSQHLPDSFDKVFFVSLSASSNGALLASNISRIDYSRTSSQWVLSSKSFQTTAVSSAKNETYLLGKHNWTVHNDYQGCHEEEDKNYSIELKLSGCNQGFKIARGKRNLEEYGEFTCNNGQCVSMEKRCDQLPDCEDGSDEEGCRLFSLVKGYNKIVPPYTRVSFLNKTTLPVAIDVSIKLLKMMGIDERENTIDLQFEITMEWKDHRITYSNLKKDSFLNALTDADKESIWLPVLIYANTDQKETTRLGWVNEWTTSVVVSRDGNFTR